VRTLTDGTILNESNMPYGRMSFRIMPDWTIGYVTITRLVWP
jgi:hypothetical protein